MTDPACAAPCRSAPRRGLALCLLLAFGGLSACGDDAATDPSSATEVVAPKPVVPAPAAASAAPASSPAPNPDGGAAALIGRIVPPYPEGLDEIAGSCVPAGDGSVRICDYSLAMVGTAASDGGAAMARFLIASRRSNPDADKPAWQVLDAVDAPKVEPGQDLQLGACRLDDRDDPGLIAVVRYGDAERSADVGWARRFDVAAGKLVDVDVARVSCANPGAGI